MILEAIVTTLNQDGSTNIAPMGPTVDAAMDRFVLRPFQSSRTYSNLKRHPEGILHITDDVVLLAKAAVGNVNPLPKFMSAECVQGNIISEACRWYAFQASHIQDQEERVTIECRVVKSERIRDFFGFNRAKHAVLEAAILCTRLHILNIDHILTEFKRLEVLVDKTAGPAEVEAFEFLKRYVDDSIKSR